jgi:hypothetical protein
MKKGELWKSLIPLTLHYFYCNNGDVELIEQNCDSKNLSRLKSLSR